MSLCMFVSKLDNFGVFDGFGKQQAESLSGACKVTDYLPPAVARQGGLRWRNGEALNATTDPHNKKKRFQLFWLCWDKKECAASKNTILKT